jgi:Arc/MetJ-type ribon-helix-helix transcriptional regulator
MSSVITSISGPPGFQDEIDKLAEALNANRSAAVRAAVQEALHKRNIEMNYETTGEMAYKTEKAVEKFFNTAIEHPSENWGVVKARAGEVLKTYAGVQHPNLSLEQAVAKVSYQPDEVVKVLYALANMASAAQFDHLKSACRQGAI